LHVKRLRKYMKATNNTIVSGPIFSQQWRCQCLSSGLWRRVDLQVDIDAYKKQTDSTSRASFLPWGLRQCSLKRC
jgi:hypothetical protein